MDEYSALAQRVADGAGDVLGCLILSRDGMVLGGYPAGEEEVAKPAWLRFATLGESQRGFVEFGDQVWVYVSRGPYAAFAVSAASVRPALLMDRLEQALLVAEDSRTRRSALLLPDAKVLPSSKPRTSLHVSLERQGEPVATPAAPAAPAAAPARLETPPEAPPKDRDKREDDDSEVDPVLLAKEFSGLLQLNRGGDEASS